MSELEPADPTTSDSELMRRALEGDRAAFEEIVARHENAVYGYIRARLTQVTDADDLAQDVFVRCYQALPRFQAGAALRPWLLGIARNLLREHMRRYKRRKEVSWTGLCVDLEDAVEKPDDRLEEALRHLPGCVSGLGPSAQQALEMHYAGRMRLAKIGEHLRRSEGAIKLLMFRARKALKTCLLGKLSKDD